MTERVQGTHPFQPVTSLPEGAKPALCSKNFGPCGCTGRVKSFLPSFFSKKRKIPRKKIPTPSLDKRVFPCYTSQRNRKQRNFVAERNFHAHLKFWPIQEWDKDPAGKTPPGGRFSVAADQSRTAHGDFSALRGTGAFLPAFQFFSISLNTR